MYEDTLLEIAKEDIESFEVEKKLARLILILYSALNFGYGVSLCLHESGVSAWTYEHSEFSWYLLIIFSFTGSLYLLLPLVIDYSVHPFSFFLSNLQLFLYYFLLIWVRFNGVVVPFRIFFTDGFVLFITVLVILFLPRYLFQSERRRLQRKLTEVAEYATR